MPWPAKSPDLNPIKRNWDVISRVVRRQGLANVRRFTCTLISYGRMERNYTAHVECLGYVTLMRSRCQTVIEATGGHSRYFPLNLCCDDLVCKFYTCIDVIKRIASDQIAINYEFITVTMRLQYIDFCNF